MRFIPLSLLLLIASPLTAQKMGSVNSNAPTISQGITFANGSGITIKYKSITWADGKAMGNLKVARQRINAAAERSPLGQIVVTGDGVTLGGKKLTAGSYKMAFTLDEELNWHIITWVEQGKGRIDLPLKIKEGKGTSPRLNITVIAGQSDTQARVRIAFGKSNGYLPVFTGEKPKKAKKN